MMASGHVMAKPEFDNTSASSDSQFTENEDDLSFFEACCDCDDDTLYDMIQNGTTWEQVNERDKSGRTGLSHACSNGFMPILELLSELEEVDPNLPDNDGNTPLIFAAQAGHSETVSFLLHNFRRVRIDQCNHLGFTALMKAAIQGRTRCAKILLFTGSNPNKRDYGRRLCALEWAKFCGRQQCAEAIQKYLNSKKYFLKKTFMLSRWNSEPDLPSHKEKEKVQGNWIQRHLSFKKKKRRNLSSNESDDSESPSPESPLRDDKRTSSSPILITTGCDDAPDNTQSTPVYRRPSCVDNVVTINIIPNRLKHGRGGGGGAGGGYGGDGGGGGGGGTHRDKFAPLEEEPVAPPTILETDFDKDKETEKTHKGKEMEQGHKGKEATKVYKVKV